MVVESLKNNSNAYTFDELLFLDDTNKDLQVKYANKNVEKLNNEKDADKKKLYIEKIQKSQIIIEESDYNKIIEKVIDKEVRSQLTYINYKSALIKSLECILKSPNTINEAKSALMLRKRFNFNKWPEMGENNFFFYKINLRLFDKLDEIFFYYRYYNNIIKKMIEFLKMDFNRLDKDQRFYFNYLSYLILDKDSITSNAVSKEINKFLSTDKVNEKDVEDLFCEGINIEENNLKGIKYNIAYDKKKKIYALK